MHKSKLAFFLLATALLTAMLLAACSPGNLLPPTPTSSQALNPVTDPAAYVADALGLPAGQVTLVSKEEIQWSDACLGAPKMGEACAEMITPGFKMVLQTSKGVYELHTDTAGNATRILPPGLSGTPTANVIEWERTGGIAGICQQLFVEANGNYTLFDCKQNQVINQGSLAPSDWEMLSKLLNAYAVFTWQVPRATGADQFVDSYFFQGNGQEVPDGNSQVELNDILGTIATQLAAEAMPTGTPGSGIAGQVMIGPTCPGPVSANSTECADKPYQATITVLDQNNQVAATIQSDPQGMFRVTVAPGTYTLHPEATTKPPYAEDQQVTVPEGQFVQVTITFDSGIR